MTGWGILQGPPGRVPRDRLEPRTSGRPCGIPESAVRLLWRGPHALPGDSCGEAAVEIATHNCSPVCSSPSALPPSLWDPAQAFSAEQSPLPTGSSRPVRQPDGRPGQRRTAHWWPRRVRSLRGTCPGPAGRISCSGLWRFVGGQKSRACHPGISVQTPTTDSRIAPSHRVQSEV